MKNNTRHQHFVQSALIDFWSEKGVVGVARKDDSAILIQERSKPPGSIFYEDFFYEHVYDFESAEDHRKHGFLVSTDEHHQFGTNDGENYCKQIEDDGLPIIRAILSAVQNNNKGVFVSQEQKTYLVKYMVLQALRTPAGRKAFQYDYEKGYIGKKEDNEKAIKSFVSNFSYLFVLGTYDKMGLSDNCKTPESPFTHFVNLMLDMKGYVFCLDESKEEQFILGDNPCVFLGKEDGIWGMIMPFSPKVMMVFLSEDGWKEEILSVIPCPEKWELFEVASQVNTSEKKIVFNEKISSLDDIKKDYKQAKKQNDDILQIWTPKSLITQFNERIL